MSSRLLLLLVATLLQSIVCAQFPTVAINAGADSKPPADILDNYPLLRPGESGFVTFTVTNAPSPITVTNLTVDVWNNTFGWIVESTPQNLTLAEGSHFSVKITAPQVLSVQHVFFVAIHDGETYELGSIEMEVSCSNGISCDGIELWSNGSCHAAVVPFCDYGTNCTVTECFESTGVCNISLVNDTCEQCVMNCGEDYRGCDGRECGTDGCGGNCGICVEDLYCDSEGQCIPAATPGLCSTPIPLFADLDNLTGVYIIEGNSSTGLHKHVIPCNIFSTSPEIAYVFTVPEGQEYGFDFRSSGFDTVLDVRHDSCFGEEVGCNDDGTPPGNYGSRVAKMIGPGTYYVIVKGYSDTEQGIFELYMSFAPSCIPKCNSQFCGNDECGGTCGTCGDEEKCSENFKCEPLVCQPNCTQDMCGFDGCGGMCGTCDNGLLCNLESGYCEYFPACNGLQPNCNGTCTESQYCSANCTCLELEAPLPDLIVERDSLSRDIMFDSDTFKATSCAVREGCILHPGLRRMLRFSVLTANQGHYEASFPPPASRPDLFSWSPCHGHYHFDDYAYYALLSANGTTVVEHGRKQGYCVLDGSRITNGSVGCAGTYSCSEQGISVGWADTYTFDLDCQWIDITDVAPGNYLLFVELNRARKMVESNYENNKAWVNVTIPPWNPPTSTSTSTTSSSSTPTSSSSSTSKASTSQAPASTTTGPLDNSDAVTVMANVSLLALFMVACLCL